MQRKVFSLLATLVAAMALTGCGGSGSVDGPPGGGGGETGTGDITLNFTLPVGTNAITSDFTSTSVTGRKNSSTIGTELAVTSTSGTSLPTRSVLISVLGTDAPSVGKVYVLGGSNPNALVYTEVVSTTESRQWGADGGQVRVTAIDGNKVTLAVEAAMSAGGPTSTGTFNVSGTVVVDEVR